MACNVQICSLFLLCVLLFSPSVALPPPCPSEIYCHGELLHMVQMARLFHDSKTFVDKKLRFHPDVVLNKFQEMLNATGKRPSKEQLTRFVSDHFDSEGSEFVTWSPSDWTEKPNFLNRISSSELRRWAQDMNQAWKFLGRQIKTDVEQHPELYSMIYVPNPFIVPGGRFREFYYWDSYWIVRGLLLSEMNQTVKGMLENFIQIVDNYGLIPNGGRIYYEQRSQPPMLIPMVDSYLNATGDVDFLRSNIHVLEKEMNFWLQNRTVLVNGYNLSRFNVEFGGPRPESYREDYETANAMNAEDRQEFYMNTKAGAESGWDFSSRWYITDKGHNEGNMTHLQTRQIVPVDLNAFVCMNQRILSNMFRILNNEEKAQFYHNKYIALKEAINKVLWNEKEGIWYDYDLLNQISRPYFYASNLAPLWAGCFDLNTSQIGNISDRVLSYLEKSQSTKFAGGLPTSMQHSGQQWDFPNGWPPLQHLVVVGLENTGNPKAQSLAFDLAQKWLNNNYYAYKQSMPNAMFEKYDVTVVGLPGGGGEYDVQLGFGWTNGVVMDFLNMYGNRLAMDSKTFPLVPSAKNLTSVKVVLDDEYWL